MLKLKNNITSEVKSLHKHSQIALPGVTILTIIGRLHALGAMQAQLASEFGCTSFLYMV